MSEATDRPTDDDAWARACAEDLAAEKERLRGQGGERPTGTAAEELFKLFEAVADKVAGLNNPLMGAAAQGAVRQFVNQAKTAAKPVVERNPEVFDHLAAMRLRAARRLPFGRRGPRAPLDERHPARAAPPGPAAPGARPPRRGPGRRPGRADRSRLNPRPPRVPLAVAGFDRKPRD